MQIKLLTLLFTLIFVVSCAHQIQDLTVGEKLISNESQISNVNREELDADELKKLLETTTLKMDQHVAEAKARGSDAVTFLASDLFLKANDASLSGDVYTSTFLFKYVLDLQPQDSFLWKKYAIDLVRAGDLQKGREIFEKLYKVGRYKNDETIGLILGGIYMATDKNSQAEALYADILKKHSKSEEACLFMAKMLILKKKMAQGKNILISCNQKIQSNQIAYYLAKIYSDEGNYSQAKKLFTKILKKEPGFFQAALAYGQMLEERGEITHALLNYEKYLEEDPEHVVMLTKVTHLYFTLEQFSKALPFVEQLSKIDPKDLNTKTKLGILYTDLKRYSDAKVVFQEILKEVPDSDKVLYYLGALFQQSQDYEKAITYFDRIEKTSPLYTDGRLQVALIFQALAENSPALHQNRLVEYISAQVKDKKEEESFPFHLLLAQYFATIEDYKEALNYVGKYKNSPFLKNEHIFFLAQLYDEIKDHAEGRHLVMKLLEREPNNPDGLNYLGYSILEYGENIQEAYPYLQKALALSPNNGYIRDSMGWYYYKLGQKKDALRELTQAFKLVNNDSVINSHLAHLYRDLNLREESKKYFLEALQNCKTQKEREDLYQNFQEFHELRLPASVP